MRKEYEDLVGKHEELGVTRFTVKLQRNIKMRIAEE
jgi:hypothetical protein